MYECVRAGKVVDVAELPAFRESRAGGLEQESVTLEVCRRAIDRCVLVSEAEILAALRLILETEHWVIEGAAAVAVAAYLNTAQDYHGKTGAIVLCGRNVSPEVLCRLM